MATVNLKAYLGSKFYPLARNEDGSYVGGLVLIDGKATKVQCTYYVEWYEGTKRIQRSAGKLWRVALNTAKTQEHVLNLKAAGHDVEDAVGVKGDRGPTVGQAIEDYLKRPDIRDRSYVKYVRDLEDFRQFNPQLHAKDVTDEHINQFIAHLYGKGYSAATVAAKVRTAVSAMRQCGAVIDAKLIRKPRLTEQIPEIYDTHTLQKLFAAANQDERDLFKTFLLTGFREQEVSFLLWTDINFRAGSIAVKKKLDLGFDVKDYEERLVPLYPELSTLLKARHKRFPHTRFVFGTDGWRDHKPDQRDGHMLRTLQQLAYRTDLNCGNCLPLRKKRPGVSCANQAMCREFGLHKFRKTYATMLLRDGFDLITVQGLLGHSEIETTRKYLKGFVASELTAKIAASTLAKPL